jgi:nitrogen regulatory protein P-II 2
MKFIIAIIKPFKLEEVRNALNAIGVPGMTATEVKGYGRQRGHSELYRGAEYAVTFVPKIKIEVAVPSELADRTIEAITAAAKTGQIGDGKIFVLDIENAVRIRTGETDVAAICGKAARTDLGGGREVTRVPTAKGVFCCTCSRQLLAQSCPERVRRNVRSWRKLTLRVNDERRSAAKFRMNRTKTAPCLKTSSRPDTLSVRCYVRSSSWRRVHTGRVT